jgi:Protein of unknown function (DUF5663)
MSTTPGIIRLDLKLLQDLGYAQLTADQARTLLRELHETIETLVGSTVADGLDDRQLAELENYIDRHDDMGAEKWLRQHRPDYPNVVRQCFDVICNELRVLSSVQNAHDARTVDSGQDSNSKSETND